MLALMVHFIVLSTFSGEAPIYVVVTIKYGKFILGSKSAVIFENDIIPNIITIITPTNTVKWFLYAKFRHYYIHSCFIS